MFRYVLIRLLLIAPTLFLVSIVAFLMSGLASGDMIEQRLSLQGITQEESFISSDRYLREYEKLYKQLHQDRALFYFTISPHKESVNRIINPVERKRVSGLLKMRYPEYAVYQYNKALISFLNFQKQKPQSELPEKSSIISLENATEAERITALVSSFSTQDSSEQNSNLYVELITRTQNLESTINLIPNVKWNGWNNQYHQWAGNFLVGNFGNSIRDGQEVSKKIWDGMKWTLALVLLNFFLACLIAIPLGIYNGIYKDSLFDKISNLLLFSLYAIPVFWLATLLIVFFSTSEYGMKIFPSVGFWNLDTESSFVANLIFSARQLILPTICLMLLDITYISRLLRGDIIKESEKPYSQAILAKGLSVRSMGYRHLLPNALTNSITLIIGSIPLSMAGTLIIEVIFNIPGMGRLMYDSIFVGDWSVVFGILMIIALLTLVFYLIGDILYALVNPKISLR